MKFKYQLPDEWVSKVSEMVEFANGATQVSVELVNGEVIHGVLISNSTYIIAARGYKDLPFAISEIANIFQLDDDENPDNHGGWDYWDDWKL